MKLAAFLLRSSPGIFLLAILAGAASGVTNTGLLILINRVLGGDGPPPGYVWMFLGLCLAVPVTRIASHYLAVRLGQEAVQRLRVQLSRKILASPLRHLENLGTHRLLATLTDDIGTVSNTLVHIPALFINGTIVMGCLAYLGFLSPRAFLVLLGFLVVGVFGYILPTSAGAARIRLAREERDGLFDLFRAVTSGTKELKLHQRRRAGFLRLLEQTSRRLAALNVSSQTIFAAASTWGQLLGFVLVGLLPLVPGDVFAMDRAALIGYSIVLLYMTTPLQVILNSFAQLAQANVAVSKIERLGLSLLVSEEEASTAVSAAPGWRFLELVGVRHSYSGETGEERFTLGPLDLRFEPGELVFVIGGNGSGKTTFAKVLTGLYLPEAGEIRVDGRPVTESDRERYRERFSVVFSDFFLFERLLGLEAPELDRAAREYLRTLHLEGKVRIEQGVFSTTALSQGQRKRLALLTAYLEDRPIYLFDEWAADQDPGFKEIFYRRLLPDLQARGKTIFVISHDDRYFHLADRLIKLEFGAVQYDGAADRAAQPLAVNAS
ncbi:MAG TPA: cyclic peptide export ABC transporter [Thermoanaerobaculia bacterium]|nr:cyclic peptide export ABC transporter [Thermoanaerobaculia bacterium]